MATALAAAAILPAAAGAGGAAYTTFDATIGGCLHGHNGVNCNHYDDKSSVYMNGGPSGNGLADGSYFFAVLTPGSQRDGFVDGADGNLSDGGDDVSNRTFQISDGAMVYGGTHPLGTSPNGRTIIGVGPFDNTDNRGGVYILAICKSGATSASECKYDAFHAPVDDDGDGGGDDDIDTE